MTEWIPVALARDIEPGSATGTSIGGAAVALWRGADGSVHAWADRCPHRGMRLSLGFVRGERLVCLYHGWQFDQVGACRHIPAHPDLAPPAAVRTVRYRVREESAMVWVALPGDDEGPFSADRRAEGESVPACSVFVEADRHRVLDEMISCTGGGEVAGTTVRVVVGGTPVLVGTQAMGDEVTALHVVAQAGADTAAVTSVVRWAHELRDRVHATTELVTA
ncbi:Rieske (2Fe-2S) protein [Rhodococcus sp. X156]|uniref:Rieske (2Fe-2S) protein n=1 Tax=Rhodococcus sp. X156 TaxID=2499145 RepID=UPI0019D18209|nr:Rieske (2Fe-2S) protein [Rhodococcus sp. X156]